MGTVEFLASPQVTKSETHKSVMILHSIQGETSEQKKWFLLFLVMTEQKPRGWNCPAELLELSEQVRDRHPSAVSILALATWHCRHGPWPSTEEGHAENKVEASWPYLCQGSVGPAVVWPDLSSWTAVIVGIAFASQFGECKMIIVITNTEIIRLYSSPKSLWVGVKITHKTFTGGLIKRREADRLGRIHFAWPMIFTQDFTSPKAASEPRREGAGFGQQQAGPTLDTSHWRPCEWPVGVANQNSSGRTPRGTGCRKGWVAGLVDWPFIPRCWKVISRVLRVLPMFSLVDEH